MKIITALTAQSMDSAATVPVAQSTDVHNTQTANMGKGQKPFTRRKRTAKNGLYFESSTGGSAFVSEADLWAMVEAHEPKCCMPKKPEPPVKPVIPTPAKTS
jgi:hypothetical protein